MEYRTKITEGGRIVIPLPLRQKMSMNVGDDVLLREDNGTVQLLTYHQQLQRIRALAKEVIPQEMCLTDELDRMRRKDADHERRDS